MNIGDSNPPVTAQDPTLFEVTPEDYKQERRRTRTLALVLLINSVISLVSIFWWGNFSPDNSTAARTIIPAIIDITIAYALFRYKNVNLHWVFIRAVFGLILWSAQYAIKQDWIMFAMQLPYFSYLIYHSKTKATTHSFRIAMALLALTILLFGVGTLISRDITQKFDSRLTFMSTSINDAFTKQQNLVFFESDNETDAAIQARQREILTTSYTLKAELEKILLMVNEGLQKYSDPASQKNLTDLKTLYTLQTQQNMAVIDLFEYVDYLEISPTISSEQEATYDKKEKTVLEAYEAIRQQGRFMQTGNLEKIN